MPISQVTQFFALFDLLQMNAGAVILTDGVYWLIIFPFLTLNDYNLNLVSSKEFTLYFHSILLYFLPRHCANMFKFF
jgi:hypothetical protein